MQSPPALVKNRPPGPARRFGALLLDLLYPPVCLTCDSPLANNGGLCVACFMQLRPITEPRCPVLGLPFEISLGREARSAEAIADPPPFERARSAVVYTDMARRLVSRLKFGDRPELARLCASLMREAGNDLWGDDAVLAPVPLHPARQLSRRYNQSGELARALAPLTGVAVDPLLIQRRRNTPHQVGLTGDARRRNVAGAFMLRADALRRLRGRRVIIVDDVITTGATVRAVARALKSGGVERVDVVSFARVVTGHEPRDG